MNYSVNWEIDVDAESPLAAAKAAREMQAPGTTAVAFNVKDEYGEEEFIDLLYDDSEVNALQSSVFIIMEKRKVNEGYESFIHSVWTQRGSFVRNGSTCVVDIQKSALGRLKEIEDRVNNSSGEALRARTPIGNSPDTLSVEQLIDGNWVCNSYYEIVEESVNPEM